MENTIFPVYEKSVWNFCFVRFVIQGVSRTAVRLFSSNILLHVLSSFKRWRCLLCGCITTIKLIQVYCLSFQIGRRHFPLVRWSVGHNSGILQKVAGEKQKCQEGHLCTFKTRLHYEFHRILRLMPWNIKIMAIFHF